jgi:hypothetical protein
VKAPFVFTRRKGGAGPVPLLGSDGTSGVPNAGESGATQDNCCYSKRSDVNGFPVQRIAVTYTTTAAGPVSLNARIYMFEDNTRTWYQVGAQQALVFNAVTFFDVVAVMDMPSGNRDLNASNPGAPRMQLIVDDPGAGAANGTYTFTMTPDLTNSP